MNSRIINELLDSFFKLLLPGIKVTIPLTLISFALGLLIALAVAMVQTAKVPGFRQLARFYVWIIRGTPMIVRLFVVYFGLPGIGIVLSSFSSAVLVFSLSVGAYCSETVRAAIVEILATAQRIASRTYDYFWLYCEAGVIYLIFCTVLTWLQHYAEKMRTFI